MQLHVTTNDTDHRPPPATGAGNESSVRKIRRIETETLGGGSCASDCSVFCPSFVQYWQQTPQDQYCEETKNQVQGGPGLVNREYLYETANQEQQRGNGMDKDHSHSKVI
jgi:hypothetical protein